MLPLKDQEPLLGNLQQHQNPSQIPDFSRVEISFNSIFFERARQRWHGAFNWRSPEEYFDYTDKYSKSLKNVDDAATVNFAGKLGDCVMNE